MDENGKEVAQSGAKWVKRELGTLIREALEEAYLSGYTDKTESRRRTMAKEDIERVISKMSELYIYHSEQEKQTAQREIIERIDLEIERTGQVASWKRIKMQLQNYYELYPWGRR